MPIHLDDSTPTGGGWVWDFYECEDAAVIAEWRQVWAEAVEDATSDCSGSGGSWSDLMSRIDELTEET